ncbi:MAG: hypothetical protein KJ626_15750 [Verrucomicrobia bacterium]|nr:hypothetical protein [Verrucomicrobiota bacterium]
MSGNIEHQTLNIEHRTAGVLRCSVRYVRCTMLGALLVLLPLAATTQTLQISGDPLRISVDEYGTIGVTRQEGTETRPQFYSAFATGSALFLDGTNASSRFGNGTSTFALWDDESTDRFTPVSHSMPDAWSIETALRAGQRGVVVTQLVSYVNGNPFFSLQWTIANGSGVSFNNLRFVHGGDVSPSGEDVATGHWGAGSNTVYVLTTNDPPVFMGLKGVGGSLADTHHEAHFQLVRNACKWGTLPDTVDASIHDAAYALQWRSESLANGASWQVTAEEWWAGEVASGVFTNVTAMLMSPKLTWTLDRQRGTFFGTLTLRNDSGAGGPALTEPFWCALDWNTERRYVTPDGHLPNGHEYVDITPQVNAALGDGSLDPGDQVVVNDIEVYIRDRTEPLESAFSVWSTRTP